MKASSIKIGGIAAIIALWVGWSVVDYIDHRNDDTNYKAAVVALSNYCRQILGKVAEDQGAVQHPPTSIAELISTAYPEYDKAGVWQKEQLIKKVGTVYVALPKDIKAWSFQHRDVVIAYASKGPKSVTTVFLVSGEHFELLLDP